MASSDVTRKHWARFVARALREARNRGMTDTAIHEATGIGPSTFHRWQRGEGGLPQLHKVVDFCVGLEIPPEAALASLGLGGRPLPPEPVPDPDLQRVGRLLNDPAISEEEKAAVRHTLRMLSRAARRTREPDLA